MRLQLREQLEAVNANVDVKAIVLRGEAGYFCAGGDITEMRERTLLEAQQSFGLLHVLVRLMTQGPKPIVAAVEGGAFGAGLSMVSLADYVIATPDAKFAASFVRMGLLPDVGGLWGLTQKVGAAKARELCGLARTFNGGDALRMGLANELAAPDLLHERALAVAAEYAGMPPLANAFLRMALARGMNSVEDGIRIEHELGTVLSGTADNKEAAAAFLAKRPASFLGR